MGKSTAQLERDIAEALAKGIPRSSRHDTAIRATSDDWDIAEDALREAAGQPHGSKARERYLRLAATLRADIRRRDPADTVPGPWWEAWHELPFDDHLRFSSYEEDASQDVVD